MKLVLSVIVMAASVLGGAVFAASSPEAEVKVSQREQAIAVKVIPPPGTHLNYDGPWKLQITGAVPLSNPTGVFGIDAFNKASQEFNLPLTRQVKPGEKGEYVLTYFFCAADNSWCRRAQTKGVL